MLTTVKDVICGNGMPAVVAAPSSARGPLPVIVLMHERYGLVQHTRDQAARCARDGYLVIAPNFFFRHPDQAALKIGDGRYDMTDPESVELIDAALDKVRESVQVDMSQVAVAGYCQTGRHPLVYAAHRRIAAVVVWYGAAANREWVRNERQPEALDDLIAKIKCPVFAAFGAEDHLISLDDVRHLRDSLESHRRSYDIQVYAGAPHGWLNDTMPGRYRKQQADAAWTRQQEYLRNVLGNDGGDRDVVSWRFQCDSSTDYDFTKNVRFE